MTLIGPDGQPLTTDVKAMMQAFMTDEEAEAAGEAATDINAVDDMGIPFFFPITHPDPEQRGKRIPAVMRRGLRKTMRQKIEAERKFMSAPATRQEMEALYNNVIAPLGRQVQLLAYQNVALKRLCVKHKLFKEEEYKEVTQAVLKEMAEKAIDQLKRMRQQGAEGTADKEEEKQHRLAAYETHQEGCTQCGTATDLDGHCEEGKALYAAYHALLQKEGA